MKKLEVGDYVKNLTEKQFDKLMDLRQKRFGKYDYVVGQTDTLYLHNYESLGLTLEFPSINQQFNQPLKRELTYRQFLGRAKMTFNVARMTQK